MTDKDFLFKIAFAELAYATNLRSAAMTKKRAIKIIMAATCCGNRRWAEDMFMDAKSKIAGKPRNVDVCYRVIC